MSITQENTVSEFVLSKELVNEIFSYVPFKNVDKDTQSLVFEEVVTFEGAVLKDSKDGTQSIVEVSMVVGAGSPNGNDGVKFKTDIWLNNAICAGTIRAKDVDERDWNGTKQGLRHLFNIAAAIGLKTQNPVVDLTGVDVPTGTMRVTLNVFRSNSGESAGRLKWNFRKITKV